MDTTHEKWPAQAKYRKSEAGLAAGRRADKKRRNDPRRVALLAARHAVARKRNAAHIIAAKAAPCVDCGVQYPYYVMDFDHVRGEKRFALSQHQARGLKLIDEEIAKCDLVCANCHRIRTHGGR
jgi:hypothetical protein